MMEEGQASREYFPDRTGKVLEDLGSRSKAACHRSHQFGGGGVGVGWVGEQAALKPRDSPKDVK